MKPIAINNSVSDPAERKRLSRQCQALLLQLRRGPISNVDAITKLRILNLTARVSELRQAGHVVDAKRTDEPGVWIYRLLSTEAANGT